MIPTEIRSQLPMLAKPSKLIHADLEVALQTLNDSGQYIFDQKQDGVRCLAFIDNSEATLINRRNRDIGFRYPDLILALEHEYGKVTTVLDGEIVCLGTDGFPEFDKAHLRDAQEDEKTAALLAKKHPATYVAFDVLFYQGDDLRKQPYMARRALLKQLARLSEGSLQTTLSSGDGEEMWNFVKINKLEGLIAKKKTSLYRAGRSDGWIKLKPIRSLSAIVIAVDTGEGARSDTFGALRLVLLDETGNLVPIGAVGSGFNAVSLNEVMRYLSRVIKDPTHPPLIVEVAYQGLSPNNKLRFPVFRGIRNDLSIHDCTLDQLEHVPTVEWR